MCSVIQDDIIIELNQTVLLAIDLSKRIKSEESDS